MSVIAVTTAPRNGQDCSRLMSFVREVLDVCGELGLTPILSGSLAVFAYTQNPTLEVHDAELSCSEFDFPRLRQTLEGRGIACRIRRWHVLQVVRDGLKVEFDATEYWMQGILDRAEMVAVGDLPFGTISIDGLREPYQRGRVDPADKDDDHTQTKHRSIGESCVPWRRSRPNTGS